MHRLGLDAREHRPAVERRRGGGRGDDAIGLGEPPVEQAAGAELLDHLDIEG